MQEDSFGLDFDLDLEACVGNLGTTLRIQQREMTMG